MPEFHVNSDGEVRGIRWQDLDAFTAGYLEALFFTESDPSVTSDECGADHEFTDGSIPSDAAFGDLHPESLRRAIEDCARFQAENAATLESAYERDYSAEQAGRDFWYTRNGHGVGFWDRRELEPRGEAWDALNDAMGQNSAAWADPESKTHSAEWSRLIGEMQKLRADSLGERLSDAARRFGEIYVSWGMAVDLPGRFVFAE